MGALVEFFVYKYINLFFKSETIVNFTALATGIVWIVKYNGLSYKCTNMLSTRWNTQEHKDKFTGNAYWQILDEV